MSMLDGKVALITGSGVQSNADSKSIPKFVVEGKTSDSVREFTRSSAESLQVFLNPNWVRHQLEKRQIKG